MHVSSGALAKKLSGESRMRQKKKLFERNYNHF
jgi:hypothetical protein